MSRKIPDSTVRCNYTTVFNTTAHLRYNTTMEIPVPSHIENILIEFEMETLTYSAAQCLRLAHSIIVECANWRYWAQNSVERSKGDRLRALRRRPRWKRAELQSWERKGALSLSINCNIDLQAIMSLQLLHEDLEDNGNYQAYYSHLLTQKNTLTRTEVIADSDKYVL